MSASPLAERAWDSRRRNDIEEFIGTSLKLTELYADDPAAHVLHAWALTRAWDAVPSADTLAQLKDRLSTLDRIDATSPYDELLRAYVYRSSGSPDNARKLYSQVLTRKDLTHTTRAWALRQRSLADLQVGDADGARRDAEEAVAAEKELLPRVKMAKLPVLYVALLRWDELREHAQTSGRDWPLPERRSETLSEVGQIFRASGMRQFAEHGSRDMDWLKKKTKSV